MATMYAVELVQITPLIHFQWKEHGATLRASELKPKLDRFLLEIVHANDFESGAVKEPTDTNRKPSLDYRVTIDTVVNRPRNETTHGESGPSETPRPTGGQNTIPITTGRSSVSSAAVVIKEGRPQTLGAYFVVGEQADQAEKEGTFAGRLRIVFRSVYPKVLSAIEEWFPSFLAVTNFGFRQSKGFGSFWLAQGNEVQYKEKLKKLMRLPGYENPCKKVHGWSVTNMAGNSNFPTNRGSHALDSIHVINMLMKSGINAGDVYRKSFLMKGYRADGLEPGNEKKALKVFSLLYAHPLSRTFKERSARDNNRSAYIYDTEKNDRLHAEQRTDGGENFMPTGYHYKRALLGLAGQYEFRGVLAQRNAQDAPVPVTVTYKVKHREETIERFPAPITFKVLKFNETYRVFVIPKWNGAICNKIFTFSGSTKRNALTVPPLSLKTPEKFDLQHFLDEFFSQEFSQEDMRRIQNRPGNNRLSYTFTKKTMILENCCQEARQ